MWGEGQPGEYQGEWRDQRRVDGGDERVAAAFVGSALDAAALAVVGAAAAVLAAVGDAVAEAVGTEPP